MAGRPRILTRHHRDDVWKDVTELQMPTYQSAECSYQNKLVRDLSQGQKHVSETVI